MRFGYVVHDPRCRESRVADVLISLGHQVDVCCHARGDPLPAADEVDGIIVGGGLVPTSAAADHRWLAREIELAREVTETGGRYLGNCLGSQILAAAFGAASNPEPDERTEFGVYPLEPTPAGEALLAGLGHVYQAHYESSSLPAGAIHLARSATFENQVFRIGERAFGFQCHFDARLDLIESWFRVYEPMAGRPGAQTLAEQLAGARRHEASIQAWTERFVDHWLDPHTATAGDMT